jgi:hypothetical protein
MKATGLIVRRSAVVWVCIASALLASGCATQKVRCTGKLEPINRVASHVTENAETAP